MIQVKWMPALLLTTLVYQANAQTGDKYKWYNPAELNYAAVGGQYWGGATASFYDRLPAKAKGVVRDAVWNLGQKSAGEYISFTTDARDITVRFTVGGSLSMPHMPSTGVSGVDLYAKNAVGEWSWASGAYKFGDTIEYKFSNLDVKGRQMEFRLYLPLYNNPKWLTIGVSENAAFNILPRSKNKPVVVYGTSIAQGGCASRPGLGWTNILNRFIDTEIINLAFSGNGQLETPVINLVNEIDASLFVLDCLPNLVDRKNFPADELQKRIIDAVTALRSKHPAIPILMAEHAIANPGTNMSASRTNSYAATNGIFRQAFDKLQQQGVKQLYIITAKEMGLTMESTVDGTHPNDIGMMEYAKAYAQKIKEIGISR